MCNAGSYDRPGSISTNARFLALELANDYGMVPWIAALLDEAEVKNPDDAKKNIAPPPKYKLSASEKSNVLPWDRARASTPGRGRGRPRATTPSKSATPATKAGSPRKQRTTKAMKEANAAATKEANASLQATLEKEAEAADLESVDQSLDGENAVNGEKATVQIDTTTELNGDTEVTTTNLKFELPGGTAEMPTPEKPEEMMKVAQAMVDEAKVEEAASSSTNGRKLKGKRKAEEMAQSSGDGAEDEQQPAKKARLLEQKLKTAKVRNRALVGFAATLAIGYGILAPLTVWNTDALLDSRYLISSKL